MRALVLKVADEASTAAHQDGDDVLTFKLWAPSCFATRSALDRGCARTRFRMPYGNVLAAGELEQDNRAVRRHENIAAGAVQPVDLHVRGARHITNIGGVEEDSAGMVGGGGRLS